VKIFYFCQTGVHTALIAANIHLGFLSKTKNPTISKLSETKYFGSKLKHQIGEILFIGRDSLDNEVYSFGVINEKELAPRAIESLLKLYDVSNKEYRFVNTMECSHQLTKLGIYIEFLLGKNFLSNRLIALGVKKNYTKIVQSVDNPNYDVLV